MRHIALMVALLVGAGCPSGPRAGGGAAKADTALLYVHCPIKDAAVWIDDRMIGRVDEVGGGVRLRSGAHRIEIRHDRYHTRYLLVTLTHGETRTVELTMAELLD